MKHNPFFPTTAIWLVCAALIWVAPPATGWAQNDVSGQEKTTNSQDAVSEAQQRLLDAIKQVGALDWIRARIRQKTNVGGRTLLATGRHLQGPDLKLRRELNVEFGSTSSSLLEVCDGETLYFQQRIDETPDVKQVLVRDVLKELETAGLADQRSRWLRELGLARLGEYLSGIEQSHTFDRLEQGTLEGRTVVVLHGRWRPELIVKFADDLPKAEDDSEAAEEEAKSPVLPPNIPDEVFVYLGAEDGVPYRVEFRKQTGGGKSTELVTIELVDVVIGEPIEDREFQYVVTSEPQNLTDQFITRIELERRDVKSGAESKSPAK